MLPVGRVVRFGWLPDHVKGLVSFPSFPTRAPNQVEGAPTCSQLAPPVEGVLRGGLGGALGGCRHRVDIRFRQVDTAEQQKTTPATGT